MKLYYIHFSLHILYFILSMWCSLKGDHYLYSFTFVYSIKYVHSESYTHLEYILYFPLISYISFKAFSILDYLIVSYMIENLT